MELRDEIYARLAEKKEKQKRHYDKHARDLSPLSPGQEVRIQDPRITRKWAPATVQRVCPEPRSYEVETQNGGLLRRNRRHIQHTAEPPRRGITSQDMEPQWKPAETVGCQTDKQIEQTIRPSSNETPQITNQEEIYRTWSGRIIRKPNRYGE